MTFEQYAPIEYIELTDAKGEVIEWITHDFRGKQFADYTPEQLRVLYEIEKEAEKRKWLIITAILSVLALVSLALLR
jgi:hypothetical protein